MNEEKPLYDSEIALVRGSIIKGYLQKNKTPKWVISMIRKTPIKGDKLSQIMNDIKAIFPIETFPNETYKLDLLYKMLMQEGLI